MPQDQSPLLRRASMCIIVTGWLAGFGACSRNSTSSPAQEGTGGERSGGASGSGGALGSGGGPAGSGGSSVATSGGSLGTGGSSIGVGGSASGVGGAPGTGGKQTGIGGATTGVGGGGGTTASSSGGATGGSNTGRRGGSGGPADGGSGGGSGAVAGGSSGGLGGGAGHATGGSTSAGGSTGAGGSTDTRSAGCGKTATRRDAKTQLTMQSGGATRYYLAYTPTNYDPNTPLPMVLVLHGANMNNWWAANDSSGFNLIQASNNKAILVYPQGTGDVPGTTSHWGDIKSGWDWNATSNDAKFLEALLAEMEADYCVDTNRVFVTGFSAGAFFTMNLACHHWKTFRAFAPVAGWGPGDMSTGHGTAPYCDDAAAAVPIIITQGTTDDIVVPALCGEVSRDFWIQRDGCTNTATAMSTKGCVSYPGCRSGLAVAYCTHGGNHMVPSNAGSYIWDFFNSFE